MDLFPDGAHVRLRSRVLGTYLYADEDGVGVSLSPRRASLNAAWMVHRVMRDGISYVLLHGAAYGRYLALSPDPAPPGHRGQRVVQTDRNNLIADQQSVFWRTIRAWDGDDVLVRSDLHRDLRANGRYRRWHTGVTADGPIAERSTMMRWIVQAIPPRAAPPEIPLPVPTPNLAARRSLFRRRRAGSTVGIEPLRPIWYVLAENIDNHDWDLFHVCSRSVFNLRVMLALREGQLNVHHFTLCVKAGHEARLTPLLIDLLPSNGHALYIVAITNGSPAAEAIVYPDVEA